MGSSQHDEVERTYDAGPAVILPTLADVDGVSTMDQAVEHQWEAVYFDTADLILAQHRTALRRRTGGDDAGWHLSSPKDEGTLTEAHRPLGRATKTAPQGLLAAVRALVRDHPLVPLCRAGTRRLEHALRGEDGVVLARLCDDQVHTERLQGPARVQTWREWTVELVDGEPALLDRVEQRLLAVGAAAPATVTSELARSLGEDVPPPDRRSGSKSARKRSRDELSQGSAALVVRTQLAAQIAELHAQDARLRADEPGSVHKLRIAARRLRAALKTYTPLFAPGAADAVCDQLRWLGQTLAQARDAQVLREHLHASVTSEP